MTAVKAVEKTGAITATTGKSSPALSSGKSSPTLGDKKAVRDADAVAKEQAADVDEETLQEVYGKEHVNLIFIGHVDAGFLVKTLRRRNTTLARDWLANADVSGSSTWPVLPTEKGLVLWKIRGNELETWETI